MYNGDKGWTRHLHAKIVLFYCLKNRHNKIPVTATWGHRPHNFLVLGRSPPWSWCCMVNVSSYTRHKHHPEHQTDTGSCQSKPSWKELVLDNIASCRATDTFLLRERLEAIGKVCCHRLSWLLLIIVYYLLDADVINHVISLAHRQPSAKHTTVTDLWKDHLIRKHPKHARLFYNSS